MQKGIFPYSHSVYGKVFWIMCQIYNENIELCKLFLKISHLMQFILVLL